MSAPAPIFRAARDRVLELLEAALAPEVMAEAYPGVQPPKVSVGGLASEPPYEVIVRELPTGVTFERVSTCPFPRASWLVEVDLMATNSDLVRASDAVIAYADALVQAVSADRTLAGAVLQATPEVSYVGTSGTSKGTYVAAVAAGVSCVCDPATSRNDFVWEAVNGIHSD